MEVQSIAHKQKNIWISITGYRIFKELKSLLESPKNIEELIDIIKKDSIVGKEISKDTVRFDINTLKAAGCIIIKPSKINGYKYILVYHPFNLTVSKQELEVLSELRENISSDISANEVFILNDLYDKIAALTFNNEIIEEISNTKLIPDVNRKIFDELSNPKLIGKKVQIQYKSPQFGYENIDIIPMKILYENNKIYLSGYNYKYKSNSLFELSKISKINSISLNTEEIIYPSYTVIYDVKGDAVNDFELKSYEKIIKKNTKKIRIEADVTNEFMFIQRLLLLGRNFSIVKPELFRIKLIEKIKLIQKRYYNDR